MGNRRFKPHSIYVICTVINGLPSAPVKVGVAEKPEKRLPQLQTGNPEKLALYSEFILPNKSMTALMEKMFHQVEAKHSKNGEWSSLDPAKATSMIELNIITASMGLSGQSYEDSAIFAHTSKVIHYIKAEGVRMSR